MLKFRKIDTAHGTAYRAFNDDHSLVFTVRRTVDTYGGRVRLQPWEFFIQQTTQLVDGVWIPDVAKRDIKSREGVSSRSMAYAYCNAYAKSTKPLGSYARNLEAWTGAFGLDSK